jgi:hypothetical protein
MDIQMGNLSPKEGGTNAWRGRAKAHKKKEREHAKKEVARA